jgi:transcriptional regulator NrdR family protein
MQCLLCKGDTYVLRTTGGTERRRKCARCGHRFTTVERPKEEVQRADGLMERMRAVAHDVLSGGG